LLLLQKSKQKRRILGCVTHFRFSSKRGKCERKPFRLETRKKVQAKPAHPTSNQQVMTGLCRNFLLYVLLDDSDCNYLLKVC
jgi:hypothetical protein